MHHSLEMPPPGAPWFWGTVNKGPPFPDEEVREMTGPGGDKVGGNNPTNCVGCGLTAMAAELMANMAALLLSSKINPTNVSEGSLNTYFL